MKFVFVSHAPADAEVARTLVERLGEALAGAGIAVRTDDERSTARLFPERVDDNVVAAERVLVLWSKEAADDPIVLREAEKARALGKLAACLIDPGFNPESGLPPPLGVQLAPLVVMPDLAGERSTLALDDDEFTRLAEELGKPPAVPSPETVEIAAATGPEDAAVREAEVSRPDPWAVPGASGRDPAAGERLRALYIEALGRLLAHDDPAVKEAAQKYLQPSLAAQDAALNELNEAANRINDKDLWNDVGALLFPRRPSDAVLAWRKAGLRDPDINARLGVRSTPLAAPAAAPTEAAPLEPSPAVEADNDQDEDDEVGDEDGDDDDQDADQDLNGDDGNDEDENEDGGDHDEMAGESPPKRRKGGAGWFFGGVLTTLLLLAGGAAALYIVEIDGEPLRTRVLATMSPPTATTPPAAEAPASEPQEVAAACLDPTLFNAASLIDQRAALARCGMTLSDRPAPSWCADAGAFERLVSTMGDPAEALAACGVELVRMEPPAGCADPAGFERLYRAGSPVAALGACGIEIAAASEPAPEPPPAPCPDPATFNALARPAQVAALSACGLTLAEEERVPAAVAPRGAPPAGDGVAACSPSNGPPCRITLGSPSTLARVAETYYADPLAWCWIYDSNREVFQSDRRPALVRDDPNCVYAGDSFMLETLPQGWRYAADCEHGDLTSRTCPRSLTEER